MGSEMCIRDSAGQRDHWIIITADVEIAVMHDQVSRTGSVGSQAKGITGPVRFIANDQAVRPFARRLILFPRRTWQTPVYCPLFR